ncbi:MAG: septum formation protein Maf [Bacteroidetes bacterium]|nr:septum formation protein Maf [Bacteroidota bacterium]MBU1717908.1 septum formation protein Maf [Bacteroidota bacterium]
MFEHLEDYRIILGSKSPRRQMLLRGLDIDFEVVVRETDENYPDSLTGKEIAEYLAKKKSEAFAPDCENAKTLVITADTIVCLNGETINKPVDREDAIRMLKKLSGNCHEVFTGVCIRTKTMVKSFVSESKVYFTNLTEQEICYYVDKYKPYDKAGSYGIQEWIGYVGIQYIEGSYFNVMGLPTRAVYKALKEVV